MAAVASSKQDKSGAMYDEAGMKIPYKSFKKKFFKLRHAFRDKMKENTTLYDEEERASRIVSRLKEQNDQLLELLLDINESQALSKNQAIDLAPPPYSTNGSELVPEAARQAYEDAQYAQILLQELRQEAQTDQLNSETYAAREAEILNVIAAGQSLSSFSAISHSTLHRVSEAELPAELLEKKPLGYMSLSQEAGYLTRLDSELRTGMMQDPDGANSKDRASQKATSQQNPVSVCNWLSRNLPSHLLEEVDERPAKAARKSSPKQSSAIPRSHSKKDRGSRVEDELLDDQGIVIGTPVDDYGVSAKKRKRGGDDDAYRPKGGSSRKRKRPSKGAAPEGSGGELPLE